MSTVELSGDDFAKVQTNRKTPRPTYYDAQSKGNKSISEDFEAFIILQDPITITAALTWLTTAGLLQEPRLDRDAIAFEALVADQDDTSSKALEVMAMTLAFNEWKKLFVAGKFSDTPEVGLMIRDMQAGAEELFVMDERLTHLAQVQLRVQERLHQSVSSEQLQELMSWPTSLLAY